MHVRSPYEKVKISMLVKSLSKDFIVKCSACHNDYANGVVGPSLLNKDASFIFNKIMKFKQDPKANVLMTALVKKMDEKEIQKLANEIFEFNKQIKGL
jgi:cytochrome c553